MVLRRPLAQWHNCGTTLALLHTPHLKFNALVEPSVKDTVHATHIHSSKAISEKPWVPETLGIAANIILTIEISHCPP